MGALIAADTPLTARQRQVLLAIITSIRERQRPPTMRELILPGSRPDHMNGPQWVLHALERRGLIEREPNRARAIFVPGMSFWPRCAIRDDEAGERLRRALGLPPVEGGWDGPEAWDADVEAMRLACVGEAS